MIKMVPQPIVDLETGQVVIEEWLCRPTGQSVQEYFSTSDIETLWEREAACIQEAMKQESAVPKALNISLSSLPYFLETNWEWEGSLEITEWGPRQYDIFRLLPIIIPKVKERGMQIWVDDITPSSWLQWKFHKMDGYKISLADFKDEVMVERFINEIQKRHKPIVLEWIDEENLVSKARGWGINLGQGSIFEKSVKFANTY